MKAVSLTTVLVIGVTILGITKSSYADPPLPTPVGRVVWIKGESLKAVMPNKEVRILQKQSVINLHDVLVTDDKTTAEIAFTDNTLITFQPGTEFSIDQYRYPVKKKNQSVGQSFMNLLKGGFRTITGLIAKNNPSDYQVKTPIATIGVRGTDYAVYIKDGEVYIGHYSGRPCITSNKNEVELCLDKDKRYGKVSSEYSPPEALSQRPDGFSKMLEITPASINLFSTGSSQHKGSNKKGGTVSSFCIQ